MKVFIYTLADPRTQEVRYVGKTVCLSKRLTGHLKDRDISHKTNWIKSLKRIGLLPIIEVLEEVNGDDWKEAERFWVSTLRFYGCRLTNGDNGGRGAGQMLEEQKQKIARSNTGKKASQETRLKISEAVKKRTVEERALAHAKRAKNQTWRDRLKALGESRRGKPLSNEHKQALREGHAKTPLEVKAARSIQLKSQVRSEETRKKIAWASSHRSPEVIAKISKAMSEMPRTAEWKRKVSEAMKRVWSRRKYGHQEQLTLL